MKRIRIPEERVAVVIGENGETKKELEQVSGCEIEVEGNTVKANGDALDEMDAQKMIKAIGRGFSPEKALKIREKDVTFHQLNVKDYTSSDNSVRRLKGRIIGRDGEARRHIEKQANIDVSIYGTTVGMIGHTSNIEVATQAIKMLLNGSSHSTAYQYLEKNQAKITR